MIFLHQFAFEDRGSFVCNHDGQPLALVASGVQNGLHWAVFQVQEGQPWVELRINKPQAEIIHCQNQVRKVLWRGTIYKDNQNPPRQFLPLFRASITTFLCHLRQCSGFHSFQGNQKGPQSVGATGRSSVSRSKTEGGSRPETTGGSRPETTGGSRPAPTSKKTPKKGKIFQAEKKEEKKATKTSETLKIKKR